VQGLTPVIPATQEVQIRKIIVQGQPRQKVNETPFQQISQAWWFVSIIPVMGEVLVGGSQSKANPRQKHKTLSEK
jgi:hypothetical protein